MQKDRKKFSDRDNIAHRSTRIDVSKKGKDNSVPISRLIEMQKGSIEGKMTPEDMWGPEGDKLSKGQGEGEVVGVRVANRVVVLNELTEIILTKQKNPEEKLEVIIAKRYNSSEPLKALATDDFTHGKKSVDFLNAFKGFYGKISKGGKELKHENVILELEKFAWNNLWGKGLILNTAEFDKDAVQQFNEKARIFRHGKVTDEVFGVKQYRLGWDEAQKVATNKYLELSSQSEMQKIQDMESSLPKLSQNFVDYLISGHQDAAQEINKRITETTAKLSAQVKELYEWQDLAYGIKNYRQKGEMFPPEVWNVLLKEIPEKNGLKTTAPEFNETRHPLIKKLNEEIGKGIQVSIKTAGFKGTDRLTQKIQQPAYGNDASGILDSLRLTFSYRKAIDEKIFNSQLFEVCEEKGFKYTTEPAEITPSGLLSSKISISIPVAEHDGETEYRILELKKTNQKQLEVKPYADRIYTITRAMKPEIVRGQKNYLSIKNDPKASSEEKIELGKQVNFIWSEITKLFDDEDFSKMAKARYDVKKPESLAQFTNNQQEFNKFHDSIEKIEKSLFYDAMSTNDESVKKEYYIKFRENNVKKVSGATQEDLEALKDLAYLPDEIERFENAFKAEQKKNNVKHR